jgi:uncharacterized protein (TIGR03067 family)
VKRLAVVVLLVVASTGLCADPKQPTEDKTLGGRWAPESAAMAGKAFPDDVRKSILLILSKGGQYVSKIGDQADEGTYTVDATKSPKTIALVASKGPNKGKTILGIYELDKGTLRICCNMSGKAQPDKFESKPDTQLFLASYKRTAGKGRMRVRRPYPLPVKE